MKLPKMTASASLGLHLEIYPAAQAAGIRVSKQTPSFKRQVRMAGIVAGGGSSRPGIEPAQCPPGIENEIGTCFFNDSGPLNGFNCAACCAFRTAVSWFGPVTGAVIC